MGESSTGIIVLSVLLIVALGGIGYLFWQNTHLQEEVNAFELQDKVRTSRDNAEGNFRQVIIAPDGSISYPKATRLLVLGHASFTYTFELEESALISLGMPRALDNQSSFDLCYELQQTDAEGATREVGFTVKLKQPYTEEFYKHCKGNYEFPVLLDGEPFTVFPLFILPGPEQELFPETSFS